MWTWLPAGSHNRSLAVPLQPRPRTAASAKALAEEFSFFHRHQAKGDVLPTDLVPPAIIRSLHLDLATSRRARTYRGATIYVALFDEVACTYGTYNPVGNC
jgi:hypothetical protein